MIKFSIIPLIVCFCFPTTWAAQSSEDSVIRETIKAYQDGFNQRDRKLLEKAFHVEFAHVKSVSKSEQGKERVRVTPCKDWIEKVTKEGPTRELKVRVLSITQVNDRIANVFLDFDGSLYDMMLLAKVDGEWKILNKVSIYQEMGK